MGNKYPQTQEAKEKFTSPLLDYMQRTVEADPRHVFTRAELTEAFGKGDREMRRELEKIANFYPIISTSDKGGYQLGHFKDDYTTQHLSLVYEDCVHAIAEIASRVESLNARLKPLIALKIELEDKIRGTALDGIFEE